VCDLLQQKRPASVRAVIETWSTFVSDRPGTTCGNAIDATRLRTELGWEPQHTFQTGLSRTIDWYLENGAWLGDGRGQEGYQGHARWDSLGHPMSNGTS